MVPAYTNGVQAMPISFAHYLLAFADSFSRDADRIREAYPRSIAARWERRSSPTPAGRCIDSDLLTFSASTA